MPFGGRYVGIEVGANSVRGVALRKVRSGFKVVAAEKMDRDPASGRIIEFPQGEGPAVFSPEVSAMLRRLGKGAKQTAVCVPEVEILLRHLPIPRSAGENLQPLIRAVLAAPAEGEMTFTYRRLPKAAPAPDHDLVLVAASRGQELRRLVAGLRENSVKVKGLTPYPQALLSLAKAAAAETPTTAAAATKAEASDQGQDPQDDQEEENVQDTFVFIDEGGPLFAIAPDSDLRGVTFALVEEGDLLFARRSPLSSMAQEKGRPADGVGVITEIAEEANRSLDLAKGTLKRSDLVPGDVRIFGRRRVSQELATAMTGKMGAPVRIVPPEVWGSVTVQPGVVFDAGDYSIALGLAIAATEEDAMVVPPAGARMEKFGVSSKTRIAAAILGLAFAFLPLFQSSYHTQRQQENETNGRRQLDGFIREADIVRNRAKGYSELAHRYKELLTASQDDAGVNSLSMLFDQAPVEMKFSSLNVSNGDSALNRPLLPGQRKRIRVSGLIDTSQRSALAVLNGFVEKLKQSKVASAESIEPRVQPGEVELGGKRLEKFVIEFVTPGSEKKAGGL